MGDMSVGRFLAARTPSPYPPPARGGGTRAVQVERTLSRPEQSESPLPSREGARGRGLSPVGADGA